MEESYKVLVIILSSVLVLLLILLIIIASYIISVLKRLNKISVKAEALANKAEHIGALLEKTAGPAAILKLATSALDGVLKNRTSKRKDKEN